jgi:bifunctional oligoribonuclease and PAP phosphatase NrnA
MPTLDPTARSVAAALRAHRGGFVVVAHVDPDGDALGSVLTLARALRRLGRAVLCPMVDPPRFLRFLAHPGELAAPLDALPPDSCVVVLDGDLRRASGAPLAGARSVVGVDHHRHDGAGADPSWVDASYASTTLMVAQIVDALGLEWDAELATPCLAGLMTDTGFFRFGNTDRRALETAGRLIEAGVAYADLSDRLQWRHPDHFRMLAMVMATVRFHADGAIVLADQTSAMRAALGDSDDDSDDFVGQIRYAEGARLAVLFKERPGAIKLSLRSRGGVSARRIAQLLGGGGHDAAAGATLDGASLAEAEARLLAAAAPELARADAADRGSSGA